MTTRRWLLSGLLLLGACAGERPATVADENLARLPSGDRQAIINTEQNVQVAQANLAAARVAKDEARQFLSIADRELMAARTHEGAAREGLALATRTRNQAQIEAADDQIRQAQDRAVASRLKRDYADRLLALRDAQIDERQAELSVARADLERLKFERLSASNMASGLQASRFERSLQGARADLARKQQRVAGLNGEVAGMRTEWTNRRRHVASRAEAAPMLAPLPPELLPAPSVPLRPREAPTDVNEGPSSPQSVPDQNFAR